MSAWLTEEQFGVLVRRISDHDFDAASVVAADRAAILAEVERLMRARASTAETLGYRLTTDDHRGLEHEEVMVIEATEHEVNAYRRTLRAEARAERAEASERDLLAALDGSWRYLQHQAGCTGARKRRDASGVTCDCRLEDTLRENRKVVANTHRQDTAQAAGGGS